MPSLVSQLVVVVALVSCCVSSNAFTVQQQSTSSRHQSSPTQLDAMSRRNVFGALVAGAATLATSSQPAQATYSAYAAREKDWEARQKNGEVQFSSAKALKAQLREIAPMNTERSKMFCPNGPSSNVSPLMENKCSDALAIPSVYGRTEDVVGNSIPGFAGGRYPSSMTAGNTGSISETVGFPAYQRDVRSK
jgi:hypothetical protein